MRGGGTGTRGELHVAEQNEGKRDSTVQELIAFGGLLKLHRYYKSPLVFPSLSCLALASPARFTCSDGSHDPASMYLDFLRELDPPALSIPAVTTSTPSFKF